MPTFADSVSALLTTYDNCLELLKSFKKRSKTTPGGEPDPHAAVVTAAQSRLKRSIRSDRSRVSHVYHSRLSRTGSLLERGDTRACLSLRRILRRLSAALTRVLRTATGTPDAVIDYESLASLSNASRIDAIKAINGLSRRISDTGLTSASEKGGKKTRSVTSHSSMKTEASASSSSPSSQGRDKSGKKKNKNKKSREGHDRKLLAKEKKGRERGTDKHAQNGNDTSHYSPAPPAPRMAHPDAHGRAQREREDDTTTSLSSSPLSLAPPSNQGKPELETMSKVTPSPSQRDRTEASSRKRISIASFASDSTKLGEVAVRPGLDMVMDEEFEMQPVYPLRPYAQTAVPEKSKGFWSRLSGRSSS